MGILQDEAKRMVERLAGPKGPDIPPIPRVDGDPETFVDRVNEWADGIERSLGLPRTDANDTPESDD